MSLITQRLVGVTTSALLFTFVSTSVLAQTTDVFTLGTQSDRFLDQSVTTTFRFNQSMILNSIGFVPTNAESLSYTLRGGSSVIVNVNQLSAIDNGVRWLVLTNPETFNVNDTVTVTTKGYFVSGFPVSGYQTHVSGFTNLNPNLYYSVDHELGPELGNEILSNGNLRVSPANPGSNVAPEPGTFALALTGGGALIGICIRRRRNAA